MRYRVLPSLGALATMIAVVLLAPVLVAGQSSAPVDPSTPPRTPDGRPDLQGVWDYRTMTPLERPSDLAGKEFFTAEEAAEFERQGVARRNKDRRTSDGLTAAADVASAYNEFWWDYGKQLTADKRTSLIVDPPDGRIPPLTPEAQQRAEARRAARSARGRADSYTDRSLWERCITRNLPRLSSAYNNNFQLFQTPGYVAILNEMIHDIRIIPLDGRPHLAPGVRQWLGDSRGHWEGDTLVVDTTNFTDKTSFRGSRENLHLIERFTRVDADTLLVEVTIGDPTTFTSPWTYVLPATRNESSVYEYACHEGNYGMVNLLAGARAQEKAAEEALKNMKKGTTGSR